MFDFEYQNPTRILFGRGKIADIDRHIPATARVLVLYGGGSVIANGTLAEVRAALGGRMVSEFAGIEANPTYETLMRAVAQVKAGGLDYLLAVGGGSVIDGTKFVAAAACFAGDDPWQILEQGDIEEAMNAAAQIGDDNLQRKSQGTVVPESFTHGTSEQRMRWFSRGDVLGAVLDTEISPELVPAGADGKAQSTEELVGPYELNDFFLHHVIRYGQRPSKVAFLAWHAWQDRDGGLWPAGFPAEQRRAYDLETIAVWLDKFCARFFGFSQFKRSALPNGPKVSSAGALSPRGDWRAPSDAVATVWREELRDNLPEDVVREVFGSTSP